MLSFTIVHTSNVHGLIYNNSSIHVKVQARGSLAGRTIAIDISDQGREQLLLRQETSGFTSLSNSSVQI